MDEKKNPFTLDVLMYWGVTVIFLKKIGDMTAQRFVVLAWTSPFDITIPWLMSKYHGSFQVFCYDFRVADPLALHDLNNRKKLWTTWYLFQGEKSTWLELTKKNLPFKGVDGFGMFI